MAARTPGGQEKHDQCFHNRLFKIPFSPRNFLAIQTVEKNKKIQANVNSWEICCRCAEKLLAHAIFYKNSKI
jgi:hypothetical protein